MMTEQQVVIIGGSEGIGLAVAKAARTRGSRVLAVSRTREKLEAARDALSGLEIRIADINNTASIQESHASRWVIGSCPPSSLFEG
jgi:short-subunit dehydrogenase